MRDLIPPLPMDVAVLAGAAFGEVAEGKTPEEILDAVTEKLVPMLADPPQAPPAEADKLAYFQHRYYLAFLRLAGGHFSGLSLEELDDCAQVASISGVGFEKWIEKKGFAAE